jgi:hypothetical protein
MKPVFRFGVAGLLASCAFVAANAQSQPSSIPPDEANDLYTARKWPEAEKVYDAITRAEPDNARAWYRLGVSLQRQGRYDHALPAYRRALATAPPPLKAFASYNIATAYARLDNRDSALAWIAKALAEPAARAIASQLGGDDDFASLRGNQLFTTALARADSMVHPCYYAPKARELDFWVGEWDVSLGPQKVGTSSVVRVQDGCVVMESWRSTTGQTGRSMNFYNPSTGKWRQTYVGNDLGIWEMSGSYSDGAMRYEGEVYAPAKTRTRMTFFNLGPDKVRQLGENSSDAGKTWTTVWDAIYLRKGA